MRHTKGNWTAHSDFENGQDRFEVHSEDENIICEVYNVPGYKETLGNAMLIASAPALLKGYLDLLRKLKHRDANAVTKEYLIRLCEEQLEAANQGLIIKNL